MAITLRLNAIKQLIHTADAVEDNINQYGVFYIVEGNLQGLNGSTLPVVTVWLQLINDGGFRFITLKPKKD